MNTQDNTETRNSAPPTRIIVKEFIQDNIVVQVQKTLAYYPYYALIIGTPNKNNPTQINRGIFPLRFEGVGQIKYADLNPSTLEMLIREALDFARDCRQQDEDERIERQLDREHRDANRGKPNVKRTGKTQRERDKRKHSTE